MLKKDNIFSTFICYRRKEKKGDFEMPVGSYIARIIYEYLSNSGIIVCYDVESFQIAEDYKKRTLKILDQIRCFILILTPDLLTRCVNDPNDDVYRELMYAVKRYQRELEDPSIPDQNKLRFIPIIPDSLFDYEKHIPKELEPQIRNMIQGNTASEIQFCKRGFHDDINRELLNLIEGELSSNSIDQINNKFRERKRDLIDFDLSKQKTIIGRLVEKFH